jgi:hypothetical protein
MLEFRDVTPLYLLPRDPFLEEVLIPAFRTADRAQRRLGAEEIYRWRVLANADGDMIFSTFDTCGLDKAQPDMSCGTHIITGGTGKYKGITGSEPFACNSLPALAGAATRRRTSRTTRAGRLSLGHKFGRRSPRQAGCNPAVREPGSTAGLLWFWQLL